MMIFKINIHGETLPPIVAHKLYDYLKEKTVDPEHNYSIEVYTSLYGDVLVEIYGALKFDLDCIVSWLEEFMVNLIDKEALMWASSDYDIEYIDGSNVKKVVTQAGGRINHES